MPHAPKVSPPGQVHNEDEASEVPSPIPTERDEEDSGADEHHEQQEEDEAAIERQPSSRRRSLRRSRTGFDPAESGRIRRICFNILTHRSFDTVMGLIIIFNGLTIGIETQTKVNTPLGCNEKCECTREDAVCTLIPGWVSIMEYVFSTAYLIELILRVTVYGPRIFVTSAWARLDLFLVLSSIAEIILAQFDTQNLGFLESIDLMRMLRLARLARAVRLVALFNTLWMLVQGLLYSVNTLLWTTLLTTILIYIFAIIGLELITVDLNLPLDHPYNVAALENFRDLSDASMMLLQCFSWDSISAVYRPLIKQRFQLFFYFITVLLVMSIALMNLVTTIMIEGSLDQSNDDKETQKALLAQKKKEQMVELKKLFLELDEDGSGELSMDEIDGAPEEMRDQLIEIAGTEDISALFELLDYDGGGTLGVEEFCDGILRAMSSDKPMELDKLVKQCGDIFEDSRSVIKLLRGQDPDAQEENQDGAGAGDDAGDDDEGSPPPRKESKESQSRGTSGEVCPEVATFVSSIDDRVDSMERTLTDMQGDVQDILNCMLKLCSSTRTTHSVKKAVAVCKGPGSTTR